VNEELLERASNLQNIRIFFLHKIQLIDFDAKTLQVRDIEAGKDADVSFDLCIGADGSYSIVRRQMMKAVR
jgi:kynurenine 3-monooxygenase